MITINVQFYRSSCIARIEGTDKRGIGGCVGDAVGALLIQYPDDFNVNLECTGKQAHVEQSTPSVCAIANVEVDNTSRPKPQKQIVQQARPRALQGGLRFAHGLGM
jgi:hypothetical protein